MITTLTGANSFALKRELDLRVAAFARQTGGSGNASDLSLERLDGEEADADRLTEALTSLPFLADKKLVIIRNAANNKLFTEKLPALMPRIPETTEVIIVEPKFDKRSTYYKLLKKETDYQEYAELDANGLARWLGEQAKTQGGSISPADARFLVDRVGLNQQLLGNELEKLLLYNSKIDRKAIELLTEPAPQSTVFELLEAAFAGNAQKTLGLYNEQRQLKVEPQQIIAMLAWQLHIVALLKTAGGRSPDQVAKESKVNPYVLRKSGGIARRLSLGELKTLLADLLSIDSRLKRESLNADEAVQNYLLRIAAG